jgi:hypothetical protein
MYRLVVWLCLLLPCSLIGLSTLCPWPKNLCSNWPGPWPEESTAKVTQAFLAGGVTDKIYTVGQLDWSWPVGGVGDSTWSWGVDRKVAYVVATPGTFSDLVVDLQADIGNAGDTGTFTLRRAPGGLNWADTSLTCTITGGGGTEGECENISDNVHFDAGDLVAMEITWTSSPGPDELYPGWGVKFVGDEDGESLLYGHQLKADALWQCGPPQTSAKNTTTCLAPSAKTEVPIAVTGSSVSVKDLYVNIGDDAPLTVGAITFWLKKNGVKTALTCTIDAAAGDPGDYKCSDTDSGHAFAVVTGDELSLYSEDAGTTPANNHVSWGAVMVSDKPEFMLCNSSDTQMGADDYRPLSSDSQETVLGNSPLVEAPLPFPVNFTSISARVDVAPDAGDNQAKGWRFRVVRGSIELPHCTADILGADTTAQAACNATFNKGSQVDARIKHRYPATPPAAAYGHMCVSAEAL